MKKQAFLVAGILMLSTVSAQKKTSSPVIPPTGTTEIVISGSAVMNELKVPVKAMRDFTRSFRNASNIRWYKTKDYLVAHFYEANIKTVTLYTHAGRNVYTMRYLRERDLPTNVRHLVKSNYYDYTITQITKLDYQGSCAYLFQLRDSTWFKMVRVQDEQIDVIQSFRKS